MISVARVMVIGSGLLAATSFALAFMGNRPEREADAVPLAEGFVEACLRTGATVERLTAVARAHGRPINTMPDNKIVSWTTTRSGQELRVSYLDLRTERSCSVSATNGQVDRGKFVTALRKVLDETAPVDRAHLDQHPFEQRKHHDGYLRYDRYRLALPETESQRPAGGTINVSLEVSIRHDRLVRAIAWWPNEQTPTGR